MTISTDNKALITLSENEPSTRQWKVGNYEQYPVYEGNDLGLSYSPRVSIFKLWAPTARAVTLRLYPNGFGGEVLEALKMKAGDKGCWELAVEKDLKGLFYTYQIEEEDKLLAETPGIYAKAVGVNGYRAAVVAMDTTHPPDWKKDKRPELVRLIDSILYEVHIRDLTIHESSGSPFPGKYLSMAHSGTRGPEGVSTGLDHIIELGVTHVHLLPSFDFGSVDEMQLDRPQYNWGYDPVNYNVPEGSYATDPYDPVIRIREFKTMVRALHSHGIRVIMDVVFNHTHVYDASHFNLEVPGYYYRHRDNGTPSDASACGNETASERVMMRKFIIDSCLYWAQEYHIDGFRFDLMGIHDLDTMNAVSKALKAIDASIMVYGEGWSAGSSPLPEHQRALKVNVPRLYDVAAFSDDLRDAVKGSVFDKKSKAFVNGGAGAAESIKFGIVASVYHPQVDYNAVHYSRQAWARKPSQCINYVSCHDNHTLYDKLYLSTEDGTVEEDMLLKMHKMANAILLTSQGIPFLHSGVEMARTKGGEHNSYRSPDAINQIDWSRKVSYAPVYSYIKGLIALRKGHPAFRISSTEEIVENLCFLDTEDPFVIAYTVNGKALADSWSTILVVFNANTEPVELLLPPGTWQLAVNAEEVDLKGMTSMEGGRQPIPAMTSWVLFKSEFQ